MLRTALKPRWLGLFALLVLIVVTFGRLGLWQLHVAQDKGQSQAVASAAARPVAPVEQVLEPHASFPADASGRRVQATGRYDGQGEFLVAPRRLGGQDGFWVVTPFILTSSGATFPVVRGFVRDMSAVPPPPTGELTLTGSLAPGEGPSDPPTTGSVAPRAFLVRSSLDLAVLVNQWPGELYNAFAFAVDERRGPDPGGAPVALGDLQRVPPPAVGGSGLAWRNTAYALQWWIFAAFAAYMWFRMVRDDAVREQDRTPEGEPA